MRGRENTIKMRINEKEKGHAKYNIFTIETIIVARKSFE